jgi:hypothetical protein
MEGKVAKVLSRIGNALARESGFGAGPIPSAISYFKILLDSLPNTSYGLLINSQ